jgi:tRNA pseudouridine38-40 synthase
MQRYFIQLSYNGAAYHGWQIQPSGISVQEVLNAALSRILRTDINVTGAGRTDAGVHASMMIAHFDVNIPIADTNKLTASLNSLLPDDIAIQRLWPVANDMHARFSAKSRTYRYQITLNKNPFVVGSATRIIGNLDFDSMNLAAEKNTFIYRFYQFQ